MALWLESTLSPCQPHQSANPMQNWNGVASVKHFRVIISFWTYKSYTRLRDEIVLVTHQTNRRYKKKKLNPIHITTTKSKWWWWWRRRSRKVWNYEIFGSTRRTNAHVMGMQRVQTNSRVRARENLNGIQVSVVFCERWWSNKWSADTSLKSKKKKEKKLKSRSKILYFPQQQQRKREDDLPGTASIASCTDV